jgi:hypothetical protein
MTNPEPGAATHTAIIVAVVAFASTILGATVGAVTNYFIAVRRERSDREREDRVHAIEVKRASRLIDLELSKAEAVAHIAVKKRHWVIAAEISTEVFQNHCGAIAPELSDEAWHLVTIAFLAAEHIKGGRDMQLEGVLRDQPVPDQLGEEISVMLMDIKRGREALAPYSKMSRKF